MFLIKRLDKLSDLRKDIERLYAFLQIHNRIDDIIFLNFILGLTVKAIEKVKTLGVYNEFINDVRENLSKFTNPIEVLINLIKVFGDKL